MKIKRIKLKNFRGFESLDLQMEGKSAVFFGVNGVGKSSLLRGVDLVFANIIMMLLNSKRRLAELELDDIYDNSQKATVSIELEYEGGGVYRYTRSIDKNGKKTHEREELNAIIDNFPVQYHKLSEENETKEDYDNKVMPIFVNYGVNRSVLTPSIDIVKTKPKTKYERLNAFDNAIESYIDFRSFFHWFRQMEDVENQLIARLKDTLTEETPFFPVLTSVRNAMLSMFSDFSNVRVDRIRDTLLLDKGDETLNINQLSDGEKCTIALFGDIARRMAIANGHVLTNVLLSPGIVLIDEVDLHLHPQWQREIVRMLQRTFPNVQFLLTTHSPQVLGEIDNDIKLYSFVRRDGHIQMENRPTLYGWDSNIILEEAMNTSRVTKDIVSRIDRMMAAYDRGDLDEAEREADEIDKITEGHNDCVSGVRVMIARKRRREIHAKN